jgi:FkbM family methyltransferase
VTGFIASARRWELRGQRIENRVRRSLRTLLVTFPALAEAKSDLHQAYFRRRNRPFEREFRALRQLLSDGDVCLDVGANRGQSIDALRMLPFDVKVISFEPNPELYQRLEKRYGAGDDVSLLPYGLGEADHRTTIHVPVYNGCCFDGLGTLHQDETDVWLRNEVYFFDERKLDTVAYTCDIVALDNLDLEPVAFIKLDVQGSEAAALRGAAKTLARDLPALMVERPGDEVVEFLTPFGYRMYDYDPAADRLVRVDASTDNVNMIFVAESRR